MKRKYVVYQDVEGNTCYAIFDIITMHSTYQYNGKILGAGYCRIESVSGTGQDEDSDAVYPRFYCYGRSESLNIDSRRDLDADVINRGY